ncbi:MAG: putative lipid II flippase FtsW [Candidatus Goldbacteria bacterium]|nr:putative lipid II flippase FtsW [Candidatus Goldiibacteriota bacterium]
MHKKNSGNYVDNTLFITAFILVLGGLIMVYSSSTVLAIGTYKDGAYFFKRQFLWLVIGCLTGFVFYKMDKENLKKIIPLLTFVSILMLFAVHIPGFGRKANGATRWLKIGPLPSFQPFEIAKLFYIFFLAYLFGKDNVKPSGKLLISTIITCIIVVALIKQRDLGGAIIIAMLFLAMTFVAGIKMTYFIILFFAGVFITLYFIFMEPYRLKRLFIFLNPWQDYYGAGWQVIQSLIAIGSGGPLGNGFFQSQQKFYYLPAPHTDYIFSIIGEELGTWGCILVLIGFYLILQRGVYISVTTKDNFYKYLAVGLTLMIIIQALTNIFVAIGWFPPKGTTLPFFSYGGTALISNIIAISVILSISREVHGGTL